MNIDRSSEVVTKISSVLRKTLNNHGHGFQYAVLRRTQQLAEAERSRWVFEGAEFPVATGTSITHIDFVLRTPSRRTYLVAECKRADPARATWCFVRTPYTWRNPDDKEVVFENLVSDPNKPVLAEPLSAYTTRGNYRLAVDVRTGVKGDGEHRGRYPVDDAAAQVLRGVSGLVNHLFPGHDRAFSQPGVVRFLPVIFTTAEIWVTEADLGEADLATGELDSSKVEAKPVDWVWFTHNRSPALSHDHQPLPDSDLSRALRREFARSIAVVGPSGIDAFLSVDLESWLES